MIGGVGHVLGWEDIVEGRAYTTSVKCLTPTGKLMKIDATHFIDEIQKDQNLMKSIINMSELKSKMSIRHISQSSRNFRNFRVQTVESICKEQKKIGGRGGDGQESRNLGSWRDPLGLQGSLRVNVGSSLNVPEPLTFDLKTEKLNEDSVSMGSQHQPNNHTTRVSHLKHYLKSAGSEYSSVDRENSVDSFDRCENPTASIQWLDASIAAPDAMAKRTVAKRT